MDKAINAVLEGTVGFFWPSSETGQHDEEPERGFIKKGDRGFLEIRTLNENPDADLFSPSEKKRPHCIKALFPEGSAAILDISRHGGTSNIGGRRASVYTYSASTAISKIAVEKTRNVRVRELHALFPGVSNWAGVKITEVKRESKSDGRARSATLHLQSPKEVVAKVGSLSLIVGGYWEIKDKGDRASIYSPVSIGVRASRPRDVKELMSVLVRVQDLLCVAHDVFVPADGGIAILGNDPKPAEFSRFWNSTLMESATNGASGTPNLNFPLFTLSGINGAAGLSRWIRLYEEFPVPLSAVTAPYRLGRMTPSGYLTETAVGIERLIVESKKRGRPAWTGVKPQSLALARRVGSPFAEFVGDVDEWSNLFWNAYNGAKHQPNYSPDPRDVRALASAGNLLLTAYLLQRCGMRKAAIESLFRHRVSYRLRERVQEIVKNPPGSLARNSYR
ncbi:hypothetical protein ACIGN6_20695 [Streptomyces sp. NPDC053792]|uniref:ApeA N-terminal domain 1-containing protein n=1 Tax=Streptomyces sp. NPDC053792 TaxID=3365716 RepID=UPI0037D98C04